MKVVVGSLYHETNSFSPVKTCVKDFDITKGRAMIDRVASTSFFRKAGIEIIPTLYANALPSGKMEERSFLELRDEILNVCQKVKKIDGVWLYLHGSMEVENIGSGEGNLVSKIREIVGDNVPIAVALDLHANISQPLVESSNIICGYRTAPHTDQKETQIRAAELLVKCMKEGLFPKPVMFRLPLLITGDIVTTTVEPGRSLIEEVKVVESRDGILYASIFVGQPWVDVPNAGASVVVVAERETDIARKCAGYLAKRFWDLKQRFHFEEESAEPEEAVERAMNATEDLIFITDSGDNTTAGAAGDNAYLLKMLMKKRANRVLLAGITDSRVVNLFKNVRIGESRECELGGSLDKEKSESLVINGRLKGRGKVLGWDGEDAGSAVIIEVEGIDIIVTENRCGFTSPEIIESAGLSLSDYRIVVVKLGYLWDTLRRISKRTILALTPGASCEALEKIQFHNIRRPVYPIDKDFEWEPE